MKVSKRELFITAYQWLYGGTKKTANEIYKKADEEYIDLIIKCFNEQCKTSFYYD